MEIKVGDRLPNKAIILCIENKTVLCLCIESEPEYVVWDLDGNNAHNGDYYSDLGKSI